MTSIFAVVYTCNFLLINVPDLELRCCGFALKKWYFLQSSRLTLYCRLCCDNLPVLKMAGKDVLIE